MISSYLIGRSLFLVFTCTIPILSCQKYEFKTWGDLGKCWRLVTKWMGVSSHNRPKWTDKTYENWLSAISGATCKGLHATSKPASHTIPFISDIQLSEATPPAYIGPHIQLPEIFKQRSSEYKMRGRGSHKKRMFLFGMKSKRMARGTVAQSEI